MYRNVLVVTDNQIQYDRFIEILKEEKYQPYQFTFCRSYSKRKSMNIPPISVKRAYKAIAAQYDLVISLHCKQIFPLELINLVKCINIHPGYNPINRGWYPQVFAIINHLDIGATIHEIDEKLDHGKIIARRKSFITTWDTSIDVYNRILDLEIDLVNENLLDILESKYSAQSMENKGNLFLKKDFSELCELDKNEQVTVGAFIDRLRALTHGKYKNAYFFDKDGNKIFISVNLEKRQEHV